MKEISSYDGEITIYAGGKTVVKAKEENIHKANIIRQPALLVQSRGNIDFIYCDKPFTFKNEMRAYTSDNLIEVKYLYYIMKSNVEYFRKIATSMGAFPQISIKNTEKYKIQLPSIAEQERVVNILDSFNIHINDISEDIQAEIKERQKQYEYYRDKLLSFK